MIKIVDGKRKYFDMKGVEIVEGSKIKYKDGRVKEVYLTEENELATDATNPKWIEAGRAFPGEYGFYPLGRLETDQVEVI
jgi:hypothetical protein